MVKKSKESILLSATETLQTAKHGLDDYIGKNPERRKTGLRNMIVFSRAVTNVIQNLRSTVGKEKFDEWYNPWQKKMKEDLIMKAFYSMRSEILKEGVLETNLSMTVEHLNTNDLEPLMKNPPNNAQSFFIGDQLGGSGWEILMSDGTTEKYYVDLPENVKVQTFLELKNLPQVSVKDKEGQFYNTQEMVQYYYDFLVVLVSNAKLNFMD